MARRTKEDRLAFERNAILAMHENLLCDVRCLIGLVLDGDEAGTYSAGPFRNEVLRKPLLGVGNHGVRRIQYRLRGPIVTLQRDHRRGRIVLMRKIECVAY